MLLKGGLNVIMTYSKRLLVYWQEDYDEVIACGGKDEEALVYANENYERRYYNQFQEG